MSMTATNNVTLINRDEPVDPRFGPTSQVTLPRRIDVHRVDALLAELSDAAACTPLVEVDGSGVEMIDLAGLAALERFANDAPLVVRNASVAIAKTAEYTHHRRLQAACAPVAIFERAA